MPNSLKIGPRAGVLLLSGLASLILIARSGEAAASASPLSTALASPPIQAANAATPTATATRPAPAPYYYGAGAQGFGYYVTPQVQAANATAPVQVATRRSGSVGPGNRNWATGNRVPLHRPWLNSRR
jgi:hypothetical protein